MAPIVAPSVVRYAVHQRLGGQNVVNVLDVSINSVNPLEGREQAIFDQAGDILNNWNDHILVNQVNDLVADRVSWLDLHSLDGSRGERSSTTETTWPAGGADATGDVMPAVIAVRVDKQTAGGRGTKSGRMYLAGFREAATGATVSQTWDGAQATVWNGRFASFLDGINAEEGVDGREADLVVVHTRDGAYLSQSKVTSLTTNLNIATQVRRGTLR